MVSSSNLADNIMGNIDIRVHFPLISSTLDRVLQEWADKVDEIEIEIGRKYKEYLDTHVYNPHSFEKYQNGTLIVMREEAEKLKLNIEEGKYEGEIIKQITDQINLLTTLADLCDELDNNTIDSAKCALNDYSIEDPDRGDDHNYKRLSGVISQIMIHTKLPKQITNTEIKINDLSFLYPGPTNLRRGDEIEVLAKKGIHPSSLFSKVFSKKGTSTGRIYSFPKVHFESEPGSYTVLTEGLVGKGEIINKIRILNKGQPTGDVLITHEDCVNYQRK